MLESKTIPSSASTRGSIDCRICLTSSSAASHSTSRSIDSSSNAVRTSSGKIFLTHSLLSTLLLLSTRFGCRAFSVPPRLSPSAAAATSYRHPTTPALNLAAGMLDFLSPLRYALEKSVASKSIPNVSNLPNRIKVQDFLDGNDVGETFDHSLWTAVLRRHVSAGHTFGSVTDCHAVDYVGIARDPDFAAYLSLLQSADPTRLSNLEQLAFWMNAYNALCIATIVHHETTTGRQLASITKLTSIDKGPVWDQVVPNCQIAGRDVTLNEIEHQKLRAVWAEPRVHACIVCASASCPNLRREAFHAEAIIEQMNGQMRNWVSNPTKGLRLAPGRLRNRAVLSRIFLWFANDFGGYSGLTDWLQQFADDPRVTKDALEAATVRYFEYDWQVNRAPATSSAAAAGEAALAAEDAAASTPTSTAS